MKKLFISALSLVVGSTILVGCANNETQQVQEPTSPSTPSDTATPNINTTTPEDYVTQLFEDLRENNYRMLDLDLDDIMEFRRLPISEPIEDSLANIQYEILGSTETNNLSQVDVTITATALGKAFDEALRNFLEEYTNMDFGFTERSRYVLFGELFLEAYNNNQDETVTNTVTIYLERELEGLNYTWDLSDYNGYFADAVLGGLLTSMSVISERPFNPNNELELDDLFDIDDMFERNDFEDIILGRLNEVFN